MDDPAQPEAPKISRRIQRIPLRGWFAILGRIARRVIPSQISLIAAAVAFYGLLAAFPAIAAMMALAGLFTDPDAVVEQLSAVSRVLPEEAASILLKQAQGVAGQPNEGLSLTLWLGVGFAVYLLMRATTSMVHGLNIAFQISEKRKFFQFWMTVILLTIAGLLGGVTIVLLLVGLPTWLAFLPIDVGTAQLIRALRWLVVMLVFILGLSALYRWAPSRRSNGRRSLTVGAFVASILWFVGSMGFAAYVANFGNYNETFGSLGGVIVLLTWLWLSALIVLFGGLVDAEIETQLAFMKKSGAETPSVPLPHEEAEEVIPLAQAGDQSRPVP